VHFRVVETASSKTNFTNLGLGFSTLLFRAIEHQLSTREVVPMGDSGAALANKVCQLPQVCSVLSATK
jgi:hypothetical protein